jgi:light-regulated signal transduction histidine kinase (bacteriophytochrome)
MEKKVKAESPAGGDQQTEDRLRQCRAALEGAQGELESFCYSISHDLRAPLRAIDGFAHALRNEFGASLPPQAGEYLQRIIEADRKMGRLIEELLAVSRVQRVEIRREHFNLADIAREVAARLESAAPERRVTINISPDLPADADRKLAATLLEKLLDNAWKFTSRNSSSTVEVAQNEVDGERVFLVRDDGVGFDMENAAAKLFKPFQRLHSVSDYPGLGMGLSIAQAIIRRHGGRIWAESTPDHGATFYFTFGSKV